MIFLYKPVKGKGFKIKDARKIKKIQILISSNDRSERRRKAAEIERAKRGDVPATTGDVSLIVERQEVREVLNWAISKLLPRQQELIDKRFFQGMTATEIARGEGVTEAAIRDRLERIYKKLRKILIKSR